MIPWTVLYLWDNKDVPCIGVGEIDAPHGIEEAKKHAEREFEFVGEVVTMIPGCHMNKTYLFTEMFENGNRPFLHIDGKKASSIS